MQTSIPIRRRRNDTLAMLFVYGLITLIAVAGVRQFTRPEANANAQENRVFWTPTPALATAVPTDAPAATLTAPTLEGAPEATGPAYLDVSPDPAPQNGAQEADVPDNGSYIANVGAQAAHSPRGDVALPEPQYDGGPIVYPDQNIIVDPSSVNAPPEGVAVAVPHIGADQAAIIGARQSATCPDGQVFYPRTGCHAPGSGGPQPGAVGEVRP